MEKGRLHIYTGDGKGKTTAALGLAVRFLGSGGEVCLVQFMKGIRSSEAGPLAQLKIQVLQDTSTQKFVFQMTEEEKQDYQRTQSEMLVQARQMVTGSTKWQGASRRLLILDEIFSAIETGMIKESELVGLLDDWNQREQETQAGKAETSMEIVLTGRTPGQAFLDRADYVSEICMRKHPYNIEGTQARLGVEF